MSVLIVLWFIQGALDVFYRLLAHMGISQSGFKVIVTKQFLYETDVCAGLQEMGGKTVSQTHCDRS